MDIFCLVLLAFPLRQCVLFQTVLERCMCMYACKWVVRVIRDYLSYPFLVLWFGKSVRYNPY